MSTARTCPPPPVPRGAPATLLLASTPEAIGAARDFTRGWFAARGFPEDTVFLAALVVTELTTNAHRHGSRPGEVISLHLYLADAGPVVEVRDTSTAAPAVHPLTLDGVSGRGLATVERLARRWGYRLLASGGKTVYAVLNAT
ncbi:hypothetical protein GCM10009678_52240 [Actinomadura kijaniata]|uniref:Anti-sigma regulatory factor (Ser/Thr protein kinase) n=1 Tax=Actinomadura namibiensis TaxID=182080 RepID=A0A7W3LQB2_ACTNM|nr:ATP-binding protein [Actinomadura namibiensis]MBA8952366.1 anti-sigma regulatory factor (Ser/Thr protein kinase) [Actinomadura namibiensis]